MTGPLVLTISGPQGSGKSRLAAILKPILDVIGVQYVINEEQRN